MVVNFCVIDFKDGVFIEELLLCERFFVFVNAAGFPVIPEIANSPHNQTQRQKKRFHSPRGNSRGPRAAARPLMSESEADDQLKRVRQPFRHQQCS